MRAYEYMWRQCVMVCVCAAKKCEKNLLPRDRNLQEILKLNHVHIVCEPWIMLCICVLKWRMFMNLTSEVMNELTYDSDLRVQRFEIFFKLMLITWVGVSLQGQNTLTRCRRCHLGERDSVELFIMWQFVYYMDSRATFTKYFQNGTTCMWIHKLNVNHLAYVSMRMGHSKWMLCVYVIQLFIIYIFSSCFFWVLNVCEMYLIPYLFILFVFGLNFTLVGEAPQGHHDDVGGEA